MISAWSLYSIQQTSSV